MFNTIKLLVTAGLCAAAFGGGFVVGGNFESVHTKKAEAKVEAVSKDRGKWRDTAYAGYRWGWAEKARADQEAGLRGQEAGTAVTALNAAQRSCAARVAEALRSTAAIRTIMEPTNATDPNNCPVRRFIDPVGLRGALGIQP